MITSAESDIVVLSLLHGFRARTLPLASLASWHLAIEDEELRITREGNACRGMRRREKLSPQQDSRSE